MAENGGETYYARCEKLPKRKVCWAAEFSRPAKQAKPSIIKVIYKQTWQIVQKIYYGPRILVLGMDKLIGPFYPYIGENQLFFEICSFAFC